MLPDSDDDTDMSMLNLCVKELLAALSLRTGYAWIFAAESLIEALHVALGFVLSHWQVVHEAVATGGWSGAWHLIVIVDDVLEGIEHELANGLWLVLALHDEVIAGEASHWSPIDDVVLPLGIVAQVGGNEVLDGVDGSHTETWLGIGSGHADVVSGDGFTSYAVNSRDVYSWLQVGMIYSETWYQIHFFLYFFKRGLWGEL